MRFRSGLDRLRVLDRFERGMDRLGRGYRRAATAVVRRRGLVLAGALALCGLAFLQMRRMESTFLPPVDDGTVGVGARFPTGTSPHQANRLALELEAMVREMPRDTSCGAAGSGALSSSLPPRSRCRSRCFSWVERLPSPTGRRASRGAPGEPRARERALVAGRRRHSLVRLPRALSPTSTAARPAAFPRS